MVKALTFCRRAVLMGLAGLAVLGTASAMQKTSRMVTIYIVAVVPEGTGDVYITGSDQVFGPWDPGKVKMYVDGRNRIYAMEAPRGYSLEYKFTLGGWDREAVDTDGRPFSNFSVTIGDQQVISHVIPGFMAR